MNDLPEEMQIAALRDISLGANEKETIKYYKDIVESGDLWLI